MLLINCSQIKFEAVINSRREPLNGYYLGALLFYNPKYLDCIGKLSLLRSVHNFFGFVTSMGSQFGVVILVTLK